MHREDLLKRISRFQRLLSEVEKERLLMATDASVSAKSKQSVEQFYVTLQELLAGARSNFRLEMTQGLNVKIDSDHNINKAKLLNLSSEGASIEFEMFEARPRTREKIKLHMALPNSPEPISINAKVVWVRKLTKSPDTEYCNIGLKFIDLDENVRSNIWSFIVDSASSLYSGS
jgi:hypothetical protein